MSAVAFKVVRHISRIRSTPSISAIPSPGTFTVFRTKANSGSEPPGTPGCADRRQDRQDHDDGLLAHGKRNVEDLRQKHDRDAFEKSRSVHVHGRSQGEYESAIDGGTPISSSATLMDVGKVALLELVEKAVIMTVELWRKSESDCNGPMSKATPASHRTAEGPIRPTPPPHTNRGLEAIQSRSGR